MNNDTYNGVTAGIDYPSTLGPDVSLDFACKCVPGLRAMLERKAKEQADASKNNKR